MVKLLAPLNYKGNILSNGSTVSLEKSIEERMIKNGIAEKYPPEIVNLQNKQPIKLIPEGNVEKVKEFISGIDDIDMLKKLADEEASDKNRKTVLEAIYGKAQELSGEDKESDEDEDEDQNINLNTEDVILNG